MPGYDPHTVYGALADHDLKEYEDTSVVQTGFDFNPRMVIKEKTGHKAGQPASYQQIIQVQVHVVAADMESKLEIIPDANGRAVGLANVNPAEAITLANFAAPEDGVANPELIHGFLRDPAKLLMAKEIKRSLSPDKSPEVTVPATYYPMVALAA